MKACGDTYGPFQLVCNVGERSKYPNLFIMKIAIAECARALNDFSITNRFVTHAEDCMKHDCCYVIAPAKIKRNLGWYPETKFENSIVRTIA